MKFLWQGGEDGEVRGVDPGYLDAHGRPLIMASFCAPDSERAAFKVTSGVPFALDHTSAKMQPVCDWLRANQQVKVLDKELLPKGSKAGVGNAR